MVDLPVLLQPELNATEIGTDDGLPLTKTGRVTVLEPYAEMFEGFTVMVPNVTVALPTVKPNGVLVWLMVSVPDAQVADAVATPAPAAVVLAASNWMEATPLLLLSAVPAEGVKIAKLLGTVNVTTAPLTATPFASLTVAFRYAETPEVTEFTAAPPPAELLMDSVTVGLAVVDVPPPVELPPDELPVPEEPPAPPPPQPATATAPVIISVVSNFFKFDMNMDTPSTVA